MGHPPNRLHFIFVCFNLHFSISKMEKKTVLILADCTQSELLLFYVSPL